MSAAVALLGINITRGSCREHIILSQGVINECTPCWKSEDQDVGEVIYVGVGGGINSETFGIL